MTLNVDLTSAVTQFQELTPRGKSHYHEDIVVTENSLAKDLSLWTNFILQMKRKDDEDGTVVMTATVAFASGGADGLLDLDITAVATAAAQDAATEQDDLEGIYDLVADDGAGETQLIMYGTWTLTKGVSE